MGSLWTNADSLVVHFGTRTTESLKAGAVANRGVVREYSIEFDYSSLPDGDATTSHVDTAYAVVPAGALVLDAYFDVITAFAGGTDYNIDLVAADDGGALGSGEDKLWDALVLADIDVAGNRSVSSTHGGTNSGDALNVELAEDAVLKFTANGTFTGGRGRIVLRYMP